MVTSIRARLGVTGGSGGGLLTNWALTSTTRFAAAVSQRSIADWEAWWYSADFTLFTPSWFKGPPWQEQEDFVRRSPIAHVDKITTPLMLIDGDSDHRTPPAAGGEAMFRALKYRKVPVVMVRFPDEGHELSRSGAPVAPHRPAAPHPGLVRQVAQGREEAGVRRAVKCGACSRLRLSAKCPGA